MFLPKQLCFRVTIVQFISQPHCGGTIRQTAAWPVLIISATPPPPSLKKKENNRIKPVLLPSPTPCLYPLVGVLCCF